MPRTAPPEEPVLNLTPTTVLHFGREEAEIWENCLTDLTEALLARETIDAGIRRKVDELLNRFRRLSPNDAHEMEPRLFMLMAKGSVGAAQALAIPDKAEARRALRDAVSQMRQALRDHRERGDLPPDGALKQQLQWLKKQFGLTDVELAKWVGVEPRTAERWLAATKPTHPRKASVAYRIGALVRITGALRHLYTSRGVALWLDRPHPQLNGATPRTLIDDPTQLPTLFAIANSDRSQIAS